MKMFNCATIVEIMSADFKKIKKDVFISCTNEKPDAHLTQCCSALLRKIINETIRLNFKTVIVVIQCAEVLFAGLVFS